MRKDYFEITYKLRIREISSVVLTSLVILFYAFPKVVESELIFEEAEFTEILNVEIVKPLQQQQQFKSARPSIPIEADEESEIDTLGSMLNDSDTSRIMERSKKFPLINEVLLKKSNDFSSSDSFALE